MKTVVWLSFDPVRRKIDYYPRTIAAKIEKAYNDNINKLPTYCVLGADFFNATIHFHKIGEFYQTTPGLSLGRAGFKQPGYRSVRRFIINDINQLNYIYVKCIHGEYRITDEDDYDTEICETAPKECLIESLINNPNIESTYNSWSPKDLIISKQDKKNVVIWEWCRNITNILHLEDEYWVPYLFENNKIIEESFKRQESGVIIFVNDEERLINFKQNSCYGFQKSVDGNKVRNIRRRIISIYQLQKRINNINNLPNDPAFLENAISFNDIPIEFICCISQCVMSDPVKTIDNHTYDRESIQKWFEKSNKSPLTGLELENKTLIPNIELKQKIDQFTQLKIETFNNLNNK